MTCAAFLPILVKRWKLIVMCSLLAGAGAFLGTRRVAPLYQSTTLVQVSVHSHISAYSTSPATEHLVETEAGLATSQVVLRDVASHRENLTVEQLSQEVTAESKYTHVLEIDVLDRSPTRAAAIANDIAATLARRQRQLVRQRAVRVDLVQVKSAYPGRRPVRPDVHLNTGGGLVAGLLLGMVLAVLRWRIGARVPAPEALSASLGLPALAAVRLARCSPILAATTALLVGGLIGALGPNALGLVIGAGILAILIAFRQDELAVTAIIAVNLYFDWYLGVHFISLLMALALLCIFLLGQSPRRPWVAPRALWLWAVLLGLAIFPAVQGALTLRDAMIYYPGVILGALIIFWLGIVVARDVAAIRLLFQLLAGFASLIAIHTIIQKITGITLFSSSRADAYVANADYSLLSANTYVVRVGSFFIQPDFAAMFFAMMVFVSLGLLVHSASILGRALYLTEAVLMLRALLFTYSVSAWIAICAGVVVFVAIAGRVRNLVQVALSIGVVAIVVLIRFSSQVSLLLQHASDPRELRVRSALWQAALRAIEAHPLTGIGLGHRAYLLRADALYRLPGQPHAYDHPHNSYLELAAMAGLPVLFVFLALVSLALWHAVRAWRRSDARTRSLLGAGIASIVALSVNSWSNEGWTLPPLAAVGWLILGVSSSPWLGYAQNGGTL